MSLCPSKLRAVADSGHMTVLTPDDARLVAEAMEIADSVARADVECACRAVDEDGKQTGSFESWWWDTGSMADEDREMVGKSLAYLDERGMVERHGVNAKWVRFRGAA